MRKRVHEVQQVILRHIVIAGIPANSLLPSIRSFVETLQSSRQTVHLAFQKLVEEGVLEVSSRRGYRVTDPEKASRLLIRKDETRIAFIMPRWIEKGMFSPLFAEILLGIESVADMTNYVRTVCLTLPWDVNEKHFSLGQLALGTRNIAGAMLVGPMPDFIAEKFIRKSHLPTILVDNITDLHGVSCVTKDNLSGAARAVRYLIERGHRRIGMISVRSRKMRINERWAGFLAEMQRHELLNEIAFVEEAAWDADTIAGGAAAAEELLKKGLNGATALFVLNDNMALGAIQVFQANNIRIPEDLSVITIGNDSHVAELCRPRLTTLATDCRRMGRVALQTLLDILRNPQRNASTVIMLPMQLVEGESVCDGPFAKWAPK